MASNDIIKLLPDSVANQIAAGEVIQRPSSVVKELVENAVDAGATDISVIIKDAGRTLIQVVDNGAGMSPTDARMAFERHATSKISTATDLYSLHTMGFRGEALPSIAAVSQIELRTMRHCDSIGSRLLIAASKAESQEACACVPGTNIMVKNLFAYLPARRKFLKKDTVEMGHIIHEFERLALVNTGIDFKLVHNDTTVYQLRHATLRQRIADLFGKAVDKQIVPLSTETSLVRMSGFTGLPSGAKRRGAPQFFFVNGRNMRHPYFHKAVMSCYEHLIPSDTQPAYFINFEIDPARIDINIHPQKHEIKFEDEQAIWQILAAAVKEALGKTNAAGAIDFNAADAPEIPAFAPDAQASAEITPDSRYNPFDIAVDTESRKHGASCYRPTPVAPSLGEVRSAISILEQSRATTVRQMRLDEQPDSHDSHDEALYHDQNSPLTTGTYIAIDNRYIATPVRDGMMLIDRHRAHVRVIYERIMDCMAEGALASQQIIFPETMTLSGSDDLLLSSICDRMAHLGFDLAPTGPMTWEINGMPSVLKSMSATETISEIIERVKTAGEVCDSELYSTIASSMARTAAVNATNRMTEVETDALVADLFKTSCPNFTPDGLPIVATLSTDSISRMLNNR